MSDVRYTPAGRPYIKWRERTQEQHDAVHAFIGAIKHKFTESATTVLARMRGENRD